LSAFLLPAANPTATGQAARGPGGASPANPAATSQAARGAGGASPRTQSIVRFAFCKRDEVLDEAIARLARWAS
jgi:hypothetical protein